MRDLVVREALETMAADAAERLRELVAAGAEIPYEVLEPGVGSALCEYRPRTARFIRDNAGALRELDSFGSACAALEAAGLAAPYLEALGADVPVEPRARAELAALTFLTRLWEGSSDFSLEAQRLGAATCEMEAGGEPDDDEIEVVVPVRGLQLPVERLELATATLVRADVVDVPPEARASEGAGAAGWQPTFLAAARVGASSGDDGAPDAGARAVESFRQLITTLRLFKPGGVGLGPYAWARSAGDRWRRIATGEGRPRSGGYVLASEELGDLVALSRALSERANSFGPPIAGRSGLARALSRAISRFEAGLERPAVLEALNDYLLALRFMLDGAGPADLGLPVRVAALCSEPAERAETKAVVDRALALERELWVGEPAPRGNEDLGPVETAARVEELCRAILTDAACGHLGTDLRATADEILLADGLAIGEGAVEQRGETAEWTPTWDSDEPEWAAPGEDSEADERELEAEAAALAADDETESWEWLDEPVEEPNPMQVLEAEGRITVEKADREPEDERVITATHARHRDAADDLYEQPTTVVEALPSPQPSERVSALLAQREAEREALADRVAYLFPRPEPCDWSVPEVGYDRRRRARVRVDAKAS
jgi:hypothetical protein